MIHPHLPYAWTHAGRLIVREHSLVARIALLIPTRFLYIERARVDQDTTTFLAIGRKP